MAYHSTNHLRKVANIVRLYQQVKEHDVPDTYIVKNIFPKHGVFISYRSWMNIKAMPIAKVLPEMGAQQNAQMALA